MVLCSGGDNFHAYSRLCSRGSSACSFGDHLPSLLVGEELFSRTAPPTLCCPEPCREVFYHANTLTAYPRKPFTKEYTKIGRKRRDVAAPPIMDVMFLPRSPLTTPKSTPYPLVFASEARRPGGGNDGHIQTTRPAPKAHALRRRQKRPQGFICPRGRACFVYRVRLRFAVAACATCASRAAREQRPPRQARPIRRNRRRIPRRCGSGLRRQRTPPCRGNRLQRQRRPISPRSLSLHHRQSLYNNLHSPAR